MRLEARYKAILLVMLFLSLSVVRSAEALPQHSRDKRWVKVESAAMNKDGNFLLLKTSDAKAALAPPAIQYLLLADGRTIMTADFNGVEWQDPSRILRPKAKGIIDLRLGQFQDSPPVFRIAIASRQPAALKKVQFQCRGGLLTLHLPGSKQQVHSKKTDSQLSKKAEKTVACSGKKDSERKLESAGKPKLAAKLESARKLESAKKLESASKQSPPVKEELPVKAASDATATAALSAGAATREAGQYKSDGNGLSSQDRALLQPPFRKGGLYFDLGQMAQEPDPTSSAIPTAQVSPTISGRSTALGGAAASSGSKVQAPAAAPLKTAGPLAPAPEIAFGTSRAEMPPLAPELLGRAKELAGADYLANQKSLLLSTASGAGNSSEANLNVEFSATDARKFEVKIHLADILQVEKPKYTAFKLSDPARYVIDIESKAAFVSGPIFEPAANKYLKSLRFGNPEEGVCRLVFDLQEENLELKEEFNPQENTFICTLSESNLSAQKSLKGRSVVVDAGHGGSDPGAQRGDIQEKVLTLEIAQKLKKELEKKGVRVIMTRTDDSFVSLEDRAKITNLSNADAFVSVHINSLESDKNISGVETYYQTQQSRMLADSIHKSLVEKLVVADRLVRKARFYVVNHTEKPAILAEVGFISNKDERDKLISSEYQEKIAESLSQGVILFLASAGTPDYQANINPEKKGEKAISIKMLSTQSGLAKPGQVAVKQIKAAKQNDEIAQSKSKSIASTSASSP